jgi:hypothetical protein
MPIRNLEHSMSLLALRSEIIYSLDELKAHPLTQEYVPVFVGVRDYWTVTFGEELALRDGISAANARIVAADAALNVLASRVSKALLNLTGDDRGHPLYVAYFKKKALADFRRPILGSQLDAMRGWITPLQTSGEPILVDLGVEVEAAVKAADSAVANRAKVEAENTFFRETGNRKKLFDKVNAVRKQTYGELSMMPHNNVGLPTSFANPFFRHESGSDEEKAPTLESVAEELVSLEKQVAEKKELYAKLQAEAEQKAKEEAELAAKQAAIVELEKAAEAAAKQVAEARAKIAELSQ